MERLKNLTQSQLMIWTGQELNPAVPLYNVILKFDLFGSIDTACFKKAFGLLVQQSDAMRTVFTFNDGQPMQQVLEDMEGELELLDLSEQPDQAQMLQNWLLKQNQRNFDLSKRAFYAALIKLDSNHYVWYLNEHHAIIDAWGATTQYKALSKFYHDLIRHKLEDLDSQLPKFDAFIKYQGQQLSGTAKNTIQEYWENKLKSTPPAIKLYGHSGQVLTTASNRLTVELGETRSKQLRSMATEDEFKTWTEDLSIYNMFVTVLFAYLHRVTGQQKLSIGTPAHNRSNAKFKQTPGIFMQFFPLFIEVNPGTSFSELYQQVRDEVHNFMMNAVSGTEAMAINRSFQVVLNYIHATFDDFDGIPMRSQWIHPGHSDPNHHMRLQVHDFDGTGNIKLDFDLNLQVIREPKQRLVPEHFLKLLDAFLQDRSQSINQPSLLTTEEHHALVAVNNHQPLAHNAIVNVLDQFAFHAQQNSQSTALVHKDLTIDYQTLDQRSNQLAHFLIERGVEPGDRVVLLLPRSITLIEAMLGVLKSGACYVPVDPTSPKDRIDFVINDLDPSAILVLDDSGSLKGHSNIIDLQKHAQVLGPKPKQSPLVDIQHDHLAYIIYTSGTTGTPKGVMISHGALSSYLRYAKKTYVGKSKLTFPLFTTPAFDLTVTSIFTPLVTGGKIIIYPEPDNGPDLSIIQVVEHNAVDIIKLTPSHIGLMDSSKVKPTRIKKLILGGEDLKSAQVRALLKIFGEKVEIYNEYGPTEATVGCIVHKLTRDDLKLPSVPIGKPIRGMKAHLLDPEMNPVPQGVTGEIYLSGPGLAAGYWNNELATKEKFVPYILNDTEMMYKSGDLARWNEDMMLEYKGRTDRQVKIGGIRVEPGEVEAILAKHPAVNAVAVALQQRSNNQAEQIKYCVKCGLPSNYPSSGLDHDDTCFLCRSFEHYQQKVSHYFRKEHEFKEVIENANRESNGDYDCLMLYSGGKDSTYALARLAEMGFRVLAFTLDNGYISDEAKTNIKRVVQALSVDHVFGQTEAMNAIFVDSLKRHCNVCNGCFKTIYTLSTNLAVEKDIPIIVTGLSRGQFFETRLTEELFRDESVDFAKIDETILEARKAYHHTDDAVNQLLDVSVFEGDKVFDQVQYLDFYRYCDVSLDQMYDYLDQHLPWVRPSDTGRSTNCIINSVGIYEHRRRVGYSNYAFPYSWDVRVGHKNREDALEEVNEEIDEAEVMKMMDEIGYKPNEVSPETQYLVAYLTTDSTVSDQELRNYLSKRLPEYMIPSHFVKMSQMPLTTNGKIDYQALPNLTTEQLDEELSYRSPENQIEQMLQELWQEVLKLPDVGVDHNFIQVGGNSLAAIKLTTRINQAFQLDLPLNKIFEYPTISEFGKFIEHTIENLLQDIG
jgi:amino acid adenylation domain-containing protein